MYLWGTYVPTLCRSVPGAVVVGGSIEAAKLLFGAGSWELGAVGLGAVGLGARDGRPCTLPDSIGTYLPV